MTTIWGIHNDQPQLDLVENGFVSIGWDDLGDLSDLKDDRDDAKARVARARPDLKPGAIPVTAGTLLSFRHRMRPGDIVIYPYKPDSTLNIGRITGGYYFEAGAPLHANRRKVSWLRTGVPRTTFSQSARYEIGSAVTVFQVKQHKQEFLDFLDGTPPAEVSSTVEAEPEAAADEAADQPDAERIETYTHDFVIETLMTKLEGVDFEHFVAHLLRAMGYRTEVTSPSRDGGYDILASHDPLLLEPPIIKVQCKRTTSSIGRPEVQQLTGTLAAGGSELGLFVTLGSYSADAQHEERHRQNLRLINGRQLVKLIFEYYDKFSLEYKRLLPLRSVYAIDRTLG
ncbi:restriction endonuclease [Amycolatopsis sp. A133]|uniref:restriction endonuclease n=1 Tax=Amycolatopsis sp. A133 TaxID=3064472 RepID=UPI0027F52C09|nr:restriction endonuclease [Amycolatopsis sp. A133]MDQ7804347.1 restriction endonuclease [Amycolatopsis sp. A133]